MRATTLKASAGEMAKVISYYAGLAEDQLRRDGKSRGPVDYYVDPDEPPGQWWGDGCEAVGLAGEVQPEQLAALLEARHPGGGRKLGKAFGDSSARAFDATFSAPKSVSVAWALAPEKWMRDEIAAAQDAAVIAALGLFQNLGAVTRRGAKGIHQLDTRGLVVALFRQHTSRTVDPHLHTHGLVWAKVQDRSGLWFALDARFLKFHQCSIGWIYAAALRTELTARLGIRWDPVVEGHADIADTEPELIKLFSERSDQVEARTAALVSRWVADHDDTEPDARILAGLERRAVLDSRPAKETVLDHEALRANWQQRASAAGLEPPSIPGQRRLTVTTPWEPEAALVEAMNRVASQGSSWLGPDLACEIATLIPSDAVASGPGLVEMVEHLAERAIGNCVELHPPASPSVPVRRDGRPVTEHVTDRRLTTPTILAQEARLIAWTRRHAGAAPSLTAAQDAQQSAARAVAGFNRLVLVIGPAGAGKTTMLAMAVSELRQQGRAVVGLAPSGKAADVLGAEAACNATTLAKFLYDHDRPGSSYVNRPPEGATIIVDEASMAATDDLDRLVRLVDQNRWRLVCVGDPAQLPSVGRGGMFEQWCELVPAHHLEDIRRFVDDWQAVASLQLRRGEPEAADAYAEHGRLDTIHPSLVPDRVARLHANVADRGQSLAITCASTSTAKKINVEIQRRGNPHLVGDSTTLADRTRVFVGDTVATRRNDARLLTPTGATVRNRQTWTVTAVCDDGSLAVADPKRGAVSLPAVYVRRHVELGWAVTGYGSQGITTDHGICVVERSSSRAGIYVGMTRGRRSNRALILDRTGKADAKELFASAISRPAHSLTAHMVRDQLYRAAGLDPPIAAAEPPKLEPIRHRALAR